MFEDEKIDFIESLPESDTILIIWIKLLTLAGKLNAKGFIFLTKNIPYTDEMLSHKFKRSLNVVKLALDTLRKLGMIEDNEKGLYIANWEKHQNIEGMEKVREQAKLRMKKHREKQQLLDSDVTSNVTVTQCNDIDKELDIEKEKEKDIEKEKIPYQELLNLYHDLCPSLPKVLKLTPNRKTHIKARLKNYSLEDFKEIFLIAESSEFLKGMNDRGWKANLDWLLNENNITKVLEGKYENSGQPTKPERKGPDATNWESYYGNEPTKEPDW